MLGQEVRGGDIPQRVRLYISDDSETAWRGALEAMTSGKFPTAQPAAPADATEHAASAAHPHQPG